MSRARTDAGHRGPGEVIQCPRCDLQRLGRTSDPRLKLCIDCRTVERATSRLATEAPTGRAWTHNGLTTWATPMSAEDMAWCEKAAETHRRLQSDRANRRGCWTTREAA